MDRREVEEIWDTEAYPRTDAYMTRRIGAYLLDLALASLIVILIFYFLESDLESTITWLYILIAVGLFSFLMKTILEVASSKTVGKAVFGLIVVTPQVKVGFGQALGRNVTAIVPLIGPLLDLIFGKGGAVDERQKLSDSGLETLVVEDIPMPVEEPAPRRVFREPKREEPPEPKEKVKLDYRTMRVGHCPRCGAPYRVLPPDDPSFSGLWNHRCTWCNYRIQEDDRL